MGVPSRFNNFDVLRLAAVIAVIYSHSFPVVGVQEPRSLLNPTGLSWGHLGLLVFFSVSGYLIARSWDYDPNVLRYWAKRGLRILPGLAAATIATSWLLGPFVSDRGVAEYFTDPGTWLYPLTKTLVFSPGIDPPGLFLGNPSADINASLWTISLEVFCYLCLMLLSLMKLRKTNVLLLLVSTAAILGSPVVLAFLPNNDSFAVVMGGRILILMATFFVGTLLWQERKRIILSPRIAVLVMGIAVLSGFTPAGTTVAVFAIPYVVLTLAVSSPIVPMGGFRSWDLSYGAYLVAFPVQQSVKYFTGTGNPHTLFVISVVITLGLAAVSWHLIEKPALSRKPSSTRQSAS